MNVENELEKIERFLELVESVEYKNNYIDRCHISIDTHLKNTIFIVYDNEGDDIVKCSSYDDFIGKFIRYQIEQYYNIGRWDLQRAFKELLEK